MYRYYSGLLEKREVSGYYAVSDSQKPFKASAVAGGVGPGAGRQTTPGPLLYFCWVLYRDAINHSRSTPGYESSEASRLCKMCSSLLEDNTFSWRHTVLSGISVYESQAK